MIKYFWLWHFQQYIDMEIYNLDLEIYNSIYFSYLLQNIFIFIPFPFYKATVTYAISLWVFLALTLIGY